mgnify:FL=1
MLSTKGGARKGVLKKNLLTKIPQLPDDNVKRGFSIPLGPWIQEGLTRKFEEKLEHLADKNIGFDKQAIMQMMNLHQNGKGDFKWPLFTLYGL